MDHPRTDVDVVLARDEAGIRAPDESRSTRKDLQDAKQLTWLPVLIVLGQVLLGLVLLFPIASSAPTPTAAASVASSASAAALAAASTARPIPRLTTLLISTGALVTAGRLLLAAGRLVARCGGLISFATGSLAISTLGRAFPSG
ncbi:MAG: hypothetical protein ACR2QM_06225 [Longimicrobiales bacterium]